MMMDAITSLQQMTDEAGEGSEYQGYWYSISHALIIMVCGMLCSLQSINDIYEWSQAAPVRKFLDERFGIGKISCKAQFYNILACVNAEKFNLLFIKWMQGVLHGGLTGKTVAIDGKTICSTDKLAGNGSALHIASAIVSEYGMVIGSHECDTKTGEVIAFRELIELLDLSGAIVVADALHCKKTSAKAVVEAGADYLFVVKDNEPSLREDIELYVREETLETHTTTEKNGGRIETRTAYVSCDINWLHGHEKWINLSCIGAINTEFEKGGKKSSEWHYYISSAPLTAENLLKHARLEWGVEAMHWLLDVHFREDKTRVWDMNVQKLLNTLRKIAINLAKDYKIKTQSRQPMSGILKRNLFDIENLNEFLQVGEAN
jgi:predicted transposase YbfD/YdcC